jgi:hypothetical protein
VVVFQRQNGNRKKRLTGGPSWRRLPKSSDSGRLRLRRGRSVKERHYDQRLRTSLANSSHLHFARDLRVKNPDVVVWNLRTTGMIGERPGPQWKNDGLPCLQPVHQFLVVSLSMEWRPRLTVHHLLQTSINLLVAVSQRSLIHDQELMSLHEECLVIPMLLHVEVEGLVEVVTVMDHHLALHAPFLGQKFQRIAGAQEVGVVVGLIVNEVTVMMHDQTFGDEVQARRPLHDSLRNRLLNLGCAEPLASLLWVLLRASLSEKVGSMAERAPNIRCFSFLQIMIAIFYALVF